MLTPGSNPHYAASGHLLFGTPDGRLMAAPFDVERVALTGAAVPMAEGLFNEAAHGHLIYSVSEDGTLVYLAGEGGSGYEFVWVTRSGQATPVHPGVHVRSADQLQVEALAGRGETRVGTGEPVLVLDDERPYAQGSWSPDGEWLVLRAMATSAMGLGLRDILAFRPGVDSAAAPLVATPEFAEAAPALSPDGRWLAYSSNETGRDEVFVRPFPNVDSTRVMVSTDGGIAPVWAKSGRELFFVDGDRGMVAAQFDPVAGQPQTQETLFTIPAVYRAGGGNNFYDISSDGERFLMARQYGAEGDSKSVILVQNFFEELKRRVPN